MKKTIRPLITLFLAASMNMAYAIGDPAIDSVSHSVATENTSIDLLVARVHEIRGMDISTLSRAERKELKRELKSIEKELEQQNKTATAGDGSTGIYISFGALIIIILLLIIIL